MVKPVGALGGFQNSRQQDISADAEDVVGIMMSSVSVGRYEHKETLADQYDVGKVQLSTYGFWLLLIPYCHGPERFCLFA